MDHRRRDFKLPDLSDGPQRQAADQAAATLLGNEYFLRAVAMQTTRKHHLDEFSESDWDLFHAALAKHVERLATKIREPQPTTPNE